MLVSTSRTLSEEATHYRGVIGAVSGSLRDATLSCSNIFVVGSVGLSVTQFEFPKQVVGFPERIGWIEADGSYDPSIFQVKTRAHDTYPTVPEKIDELMKVNRSTKINQ